MQLVNVEVNAKSQCNEANEGYIIDRFRDYNITKDHMFKIRVYYILQY